jgi:hypothetical protein
MFSTLLRDKQQKNGFYSSVTEFPMQLKTLAEEGTSATKKHHFFKTNKKQNHSSSEENDEQPISPDHSMSNSEDEGSLKLPASKDKTKTRSPKAPINDNKKC